MADAEVDFVRIVTDEFDELHVGGEVLYPRKAGNEV
jgi:hypothetical protein